MRGLYIIVEGPTEEEFVKAIVQPWFASFGIHDVRAILLQTSPGHKGGAVSYGRYHFNAIQLLKHETDVLVTSLIDYFRLDTHFPGIADAKGIADKLDRVTYLEQQLVTAIDNPRFHPYIQLHELEGLLFADIAGFNYLGDIVPPKSRTAIETIIDQYENPELINDDAAPSKRLIDLIPGYRKTLYGPIIATENGISVVKNKCVRFNNWLETLRQKMIAA